MYDVTSWAFAQSLLPWKSSNYYVFCVCVCVCVFVCGLSNPRRTTHAHILLSSLACPNVQYFSPLSHKRRNYRKKITERKCVLSFSLPCLSKNLSFYE
jgi:hypothetical protein